MEDVDILETINENIENNLLLLIMILFLQYRKKTKKI